MSLLSLIFLLIFCVVLFSTYIIIRRNLLTLRSASLLCSVGAVTSIFAFGLAEELSLLHALVIGLVVGLIFTGAVVAMAAFFQANQPGEIDAYLADERPRPE